MSLRTTAAVLSACDIKYRLTKNPYIIFEIANQFSIWLAIVANQFFSNKMLPVLYVINYETGEFITSITIEYGLRNISKQTL